MLTLDIFKYIAETENVLYASLITLDWAVPGHPESVSQIRDRGSSLPSSLFHFLMP